MYNKWPILVFFLFPVMSQAMLEQEVAALLADLGGPQQVIAPVQVPAVVNKPVAIQEPAWKVSLAQGISQVLKNTKIQSRGSRIKHFSLVIQSHIEQYGYEYLHHPVYQDPVMGTMTANRIIQDYRFKGIVTKAHKIYLQKKDDEFKTSMQAMGQGSPVVNDAPAKRPCPSVGSSPTKSPQKKIQLVEQGEKAKAVRKLNFAQDEALGDKSECLPHEDALKQIYQEQLYKTGSHIKSTTNGKFARAIKAWIEIYNIQNVSDIRLTHKRRNISLSQFIVMADDNKLFFDLVKESKLSLTKEVDDEIRKHPSGNIYGYRKIFQDKILAIQSK